MRLLDRQRLVILVLTSINQHLKKKNSYKMSGGRRIALQGCLRQLMSRNRKETLKPANQVYVVKGQYFYSI
ncbi:hypothetical protein CF392_15900 [Tamilnaduibacter salinus]|uniref:Uncharacterized protein n=1 Tax=Tamilnaduibacter salinus TaxID=1484056 RepID=A0A2A2HZR0_9GAMM|nr:hypothetical protein CF392_15900 [Tamilnaduibacter salinus]